MSTEDKTPDGDVTITPNKSDDLLRNMSDLKDAIAKRDQWKTKATEATDQNSALQEQVDDLTRKQQLVDGEYKSVFDGMQTEYKTLKEESARLQNVVSAYEQETKVKSFTDEALKTVRHRDRAEVMLLGLATLGKVDLMPESDMAEHAEKARKLLEEMDPSLFSAESATKSARPGNLTGRDLSNSTGARRPGQYVPLHQLLGKK